MSLNIGEVLKDMADAMKDSVREDVGDISEYAKQILENKKESLEELGAARLSGEIDDEIFDREINREKTVVETELLTIQIMTKAQAQKAVNAAIDVFVQAVKVAL